MQVDIELQPLVEEEGVVGEGEGVTGEGVEAASGLRDDSRSGIRESVLNDSLSEGVMQRRVRRDGVDVLRSPTVVVGEDSSEHYVLDMTSDSVEGEGVRGDVESPQDYDQDFDVRESMMM